MGQRRLAMSCGSTRAGLVDAPARHAVHGVALPPGAARRRGHAEAGSPTSASCSSRRAAPTSPSPAAGPWPSTAATASAGTRSSPARSPSATCSRRCSCSTRTARPVVLNMAVPVHAEGVTVLDNWDTLGMRGTGSHDVDIHDVFVPAERVLARRPYGVLDPPLQVIVTVAMPVVSAVYLGVAEAARDAAVEPRRRHAAGRRPDDPAPGRRHGQPPADHVVGARRRAAHGR